MLGDLLTASKPELLDNGDDSRLRALLHDYFAFARDLQATRERFAAYIGLSPTQYMILIAIAHASPEKLLGISQIAQKLHLSGAFVTIEVNRLESSGLVRKKAHPTDGRRIQLVVTETGVASLRKLAAFQRPVNDALFDMLSHDEVRVLANLVGKLAANSGNAVKLAQHIEATMMKSQS